jgi:hypothetical protein
VLCYDIKAVLIYSYLPSKIGYFVVYFPNSSHFQAVKIVCTSCSSSVHFLDIDASGTFPISLRFPLSLAYPLTITPLGKVEFADWFFN